VSAETVHVSPRPGVVDDDRVLDPVGGVVDVLGLGRVDQLDRVAVDDDLIVFLVGDDRAGERTVDRVAAKQARSLLDIVVLLWSKDDRAEAKLGA
jgi:hypothetical protein